MAQKKAETRCNTSSPLQLNHLNHSRFMSGTGSQQRAWTDFFSVSAWVQNDVVQWICTPQLRENALNWRKLHDHEKTVFQGVQTGCHQSGFRSGLYPS